MAQPPEPLKDAGEPVAPDGWMARYGSALRRYFAKRVPPAEAEDLVQDVFLAMQVRGEIRDPEQADRYLFRVAANALARRRQRQRWDWAHPEELDGGFAPRDELHPERIMLDRERLAQFTAAHGRGLHPPPLRGDDLPRDRPPHGGVGAHGRALRLARHALASSVAWMRRMARETKCSTVRTDTPMRRAISR